MSAPVQHVPPPWPAGLVVVCGDCDDSRLAKRLRKSLKGRLKGAPRAPRARVVVSSCLDVCPKRALTVGVGGADGLHCLVVRDLDEGMAAVLGTLDPA